MAEIDRHNNRGWPKTKQQDDLCQALVVEGLSPVDAGRRAGYSETTVKKKIPSLLKQLAPYIAHLRAAKAEVIQRNFDVTVDAVVDELAAMGFINPKDYIRVVEYRGTPMVIGKAPDKLTDDQAKAVASWQRKKVVVDGGYDFDYQYTFYDKRQSLRDMGQHLGMFNEKLILEQRITKTYKVDLSQVPDEILEKWMEELRTHAAQLPDKSGPATIDHETGAVS
jgi:phage terminase small subunit